MRLTFDVQNARRNHRLNNRSPRTMHLFMTGDWKPVDEVVGAA
jgi:hypothetical protein